MTTVEEKLRQLAPINSRRADLGWLFYLTGDSSERREADELFDVLLFQDTEKGYKKRILLDPPRPDYCEGEYQLGTVIYPPGENYCSFGLRESEWVKHILIVGMTGVGKTNLALHIVRQLRERRKPAIDFRLEEEL